MSDLVVDGLGWFGAGVVVLAYALVSAGRVGARAIGYQAMNLGGSALLILNTAYHSAFPSFAVNVVWAAVAALTLARGFRGQPDHSA
ncbi:MAG TPA: hypothetical protein VM597_21485 [Gemmataceae bacterium]|jgi:hypothetical protein|nr:hypothetical protein [Gemmataceae bacterium]